MVALGASFDLGFSFLWDVLEENADARTSATAVESQEIVMLSGKEGESRTKTSSGERRPRRQPELRSSFFRMDPS